MPVSGFLNSPLYFSIRIRYSNGMGTGSMERDAAKEQDASAGRREEKIKTICKGTKAVEKTVF